MMWCGVACQAIETLRYRCFQIARNIITSVNNILSIYIFHLKVKLLIRILISVLNNIQKHKLPKPYNK